MKTNNYLAYLVLLILFSSCARTNDELGQGKIDKPRPEIIYATDDFGHLQCESKKCDGGFCTYSSLDTFKFGSYLSDVFIKKLDSKYYYIHLDSILIDSIVIKQKIEYSIPGNRFIKREIRNELIFTPYKVFDAKKRFREGEFHFFFYSED